MVVKMVSVILTILIVLLNNVFNFLLRPKSTLVILLLFCALFSSLGYCKLFEPFDVRYQNAQKGGIRFLSNVAISCSSGNCSNLQSQMPPSGNGANDNQNMQYVDIDDDFSTFMSTSDSLDLENIAINYNCIQV